MWKSSWIMAGGNATRSPRAAPERAHQRGVSPLDRPPGGRAGRPALETRAARAATRSPLLSSREGCCKIAHPMISEASRDRFAALAARVREGAGRWLVLTHDNPDPDALASAVLLGRILRRGLGQKVTVAYGGIVGRAENREMVRALRLPLSHVRRLNLRNYGRFALVDTQPRSGNNQLPREATAEIVV